MIFRICLILNPLVIKAETVRTAATQSVKSPIAKSGKQAEEL